jgi:hypothetical protein
MSDSCVRGLPDVIFSSLRTADTLSLSKAAPSFSFRAQFRSGRIQPLRIVGELVDEHLSPIGRNVMFRGKISGLERRRALFVLRRIPLRLVVGHW